MRSILPKKEELVARVAKLDEKEDERCTAVSAQVDTKAGIASY